MPFKLFFDGSLRNQTVTYGFVIYSDDKIIERGNGKHVGGNFSSNSAEYMGLIAGLIKCIELDIKDVDIYGDSNLAISQINGDFRVKSPALRSFYSIVKILECSFDNISFTWVKRSENSEADKQTRI